MNTITKSLQKALNQVALNPDPFKSANAEVLRLMLEQEKNESPCLRCQKSDWIIAWDAGSKDEMGQWTPVHVVCRGYVAIPMNESGLGYARPYRTTFFCSAEEKDEGLGASSISFKSNREDGFQRHPTESQRPVIQVDIDQEQQRRELNRA